MNAWPVYACRLSFDMPEPCQGKTASPGFRLGAGFRMTFFLDEPLSAGLDDDAEDAPFQDGFRVSAVMPGPFFHGGSFLALGPGPKSAGRSELRLAGRASLTGRLSCLAAHLGL